LLSFRGAGAPPCAAFPRGLNARREKEQQMNQGMTTWVLVADSAAARIFDFTDPAGEWHLRQTLEGDAPGEAAGPVRKSSIHKGALHGHGESTPKEVIERKFAHTLAAALERGHNDNEFGQLMVVAPPRLLGELRENWSRAVKGAAVAEVNKDYSHCGVEELMRLLRPELPA
jgi:protein required for attachment to host cells